MVFFAVAAFMKISDEEWKEAAEAAWKAIQATEYKRAVDILDPLYRKYPHDVRVVKFYASTLADYAFSLRPARRRALQARGRKLLAGLMPRLRWVDRTLAYSTRNEYYYHSQKYDKQYALGLEFVKAGTKKAYYSQGVGAAWQAYGHAKKGRRYLARLWAKRAVRGWENLFKVNDKYYNSYVHYALALGILGRAAEMEAALKRSAKLCGQPDTYHEFADIREKVAGLTLGK